MLISGRPLSRQDVQKNARLSTGDRKRGEGKTPRAYAPTAPAVCSVAISSRTAGPIVEETAARRR